MNSILFSIIVPVYNSAPYLEECIQSLLKQTLSNYEILLVENGSTDSSPTLCDLYEKKYISIKTFHIPNRGLSDARNFGVNHSSGKYIIFVDSDDYIKSTALSDFYQTIQKFPNIPVITSNGKFLTYKNKMFPATYPFVLDSLNGKDGLTWVIAFLQNGVDDWNAPGKCFMRDFWVANRFQFKVGRLSEDVELIYKILLKASQMAYIDTFYYYRQARPDSIITKASSKLVEDTILNLKEWNEYLIAAAFLDEQQKQLFYERFAKQFCTSVLGMIYAFPKSTRKELKRKAISINYYLSKSNGKIVKLSRLISQKVSFDFLCICLYIARCFFRHLSKIKWVIHGHKLTIS